jgi:hypothetical protein
VHKNGVRNFTSTLAHEILKSLQTSFLGAKVHQIFQLRNMISTYTKDFSMEKNCPNLPDFLKIKVFSNRQIFMISSIR